MRVIHKNLCHIDVGSTLELAVPVVEAFKEAAAQQATAFFDTVYADTPSVQYVKCKYIRVTVYENLQGVVNVYSVTKDTYDLLKGRVTPVFHIAVQYDAAKQAVVLTHPENSSYREAAYLLYNSHIEYGMVPQDTNISEWPLDKVINYLQWQIISDRQKTLTSQAVLHLLARIMELEEAANEAIG